MSPLLDPFVRGVVVGALAVAGLAIFNSGVARAARIASAMACVSISAWTITESPSMSGAFGNALPLLILAFPVAGAFWLMLMTVFEDRRLTALNLAPAALLFLTGFLQVVTHGPFHEATWALRNIAGGLLTLHAAYVIVRGWRGDLIENRRRMRALVLGFAALFSTTEVTLALVHKLDPKGPWMALAVGELYGAVIVVLIAVSAGALFLQARPALFGGSRRAELTPDARVEAADRLLIGRLDAFLAAEGWRREGLSIGTLAGELNVPEHRLRRLINNRLGHRNFAEFLNASRIAAAQRRLADPAQARTTVAAIAFDLGYGSLGPFNRAFRAATGATPTEWRRAALQASPDLAPAV